MSGLFPVPARRRQQHDEPRCHQCNGPLGARAVRVSTNVGPRDLCGPKCEKAYEAGEPLVCGEPPVTAADLPPDMDPREARAALAEWMR